ncbi:hypothetical protein AURDEDRAFT_163808 [Auricularia subglabra TFB-10046 SS5]|nr:hypothetical protein AURDEDRAFT_163808 [Auricularia subglabra TFB-10046 SS5]
MSPTPVLASGMSSHEHAFLYFVVYVAILAGRRAIAGFAALHLFRPPTVPVGERIALLGGTQRARRNVLFPGLVTGAGCLLINSFIIWEALSQHSWITQLLTWWLTFGTVFLASAFLVIKVTSHPTETADSASHLDALGLIAQEIAVVLVLVPLLSWFTRTSYYNRHYFDFIDTTFVSYVLQPLLGLWCFYWATGLRAPDADDGPETTPAPEV